MDHVNEMRQLRCQQWLCANKTDEEMSSSGQGPGQVSVRKCKRTQDSKKRTWTTPFGMLIRAQSSLQFNLGLTLMQVKLVINKLSSNTSDSNIQREQREGS